MIIETIFVTIYTIFNAFIQALPQSNGFPIEIDSAVNYFAQFIHIFDFILPTTDLFNAMIFLLLFRLAHFALKMFTIIRFVVLPRFM